MKRWRIPLEYNGTVMTTPNESPDGEWVRYEDIVKLIKQETIAMPQERNRNMKQGVLLIDDKRDIDAERTCRDYYEGIKALQEKKWDHLILDHELSEDSGYPTGLDVMKWLKENPQHLPGKITSCSISWWARQEVDKICKELYK